MNIEDLVKDADRLAKEEIKKYEVPVMNHYNIAMENGIRLAEMYNANIEVVKIGLSLMDVKLGEAHSLNQAKNHTTMGVEYTKKIIENYGLDEKTRKIIINCVEAHHGTIPYLSIEAEICANADGYRFIHPKGVFTYLTILGKRFEDWNSVLDQLEFKLEEKHNVLSLDKAKEELDAYYYTFKDFINRSRD